MYTNIVVSFSIIYIVGTYIYVILSIVYSCIATLRWH